MSDTHEQAEFGRMDVGSRFSDEPIVREHIRTRLQPLVMLTETLDNVLDRAIDVIGKHPHPGAPAKVGMILINRLANDLRVCALVSQLGYGLQALVLSGSVIELVGSLSYVGTSDDRASTWARHSDLCRAYPPRVRDGIDATLAALNITDTAVGDNWYRAYRDMCMAKHANPRLSLVHGLQIDSYGEYFVLAGPDGSEQGTSWSAQALWYSLAFGVAGALVAIGHCSDEKLQEQVRSDALVLNDRRHGLTSWYLAVAGPESSPEKEAAALKSEADRLRSETDQLGRETSRLRGETSRLRRETP